MELAFGVYLGVVREMVGNVMLYVLGIVHVIHIVCLYGGAHAPPTLTLPHHDSLDIHTIGGQVKCSVRSIFSCCFALAILSVRCGVVALVADVVANAVNPLFATRRGTCLLRATPGMLLDGRQGWVAGMR